MTLLITKSLGNYNVSGTSSIPVITSATDFPFLSLKAKVQRCLKYNDCTYQDFRNQDRTLESSNSLQILQLNIWRLRSKTGELINSMSTPVRYEILTAVLMKIWSLLGHGTVSLGTRLLMFKRT